MTLETKRRYVRGNRGTPMAYITVKTVPLNDFVLITQKVGSIESVVILEGEDEVKAAIKHLQESLEKLQAAKHILGEAK